MKRLATWFIVSTCCVFFATNTFAQEQEELLSFKYKEFVVAIDSLAVKDVSTFSDGMLAGFFWRMSITQYYPPQAQKFVRQLAQNLQKLSAGNQQKLIEVVSGLNDTLASNSIWQQPQLLKTTKARVAAYACYCRLGNQFFSSKNLGANADTVWQQAISILAEPSKLLTEDELLAAHFLPNEYVYVSLQHVNRDSAGELRIRTPNNKWLRDEHNNIISFPQLARSITNLPYCITNGNTPQGLYKVGSVEVSDNSWIGTTPNLQLALPFEEAQTPFFDSLLNNKYVVYHNLLGDLSSNKNAWESYYAGALGRSEIIAHGTAIPTEWYRKLPFFPYTPSMGCLCMPEVWKQAGLPVTSSQKQFMELHKSLVNKPKYLLVINVR